MAYVKILNNEAVEYPYTDAQLKKEHRNVSFPSSMNDAIRSSYGMLKVIIADAPIYNAATQKFVTDTMPTKDEATNTWVLNHSVVDMTADEIAERDAMTAKANRNKRNDLIAETDYLALSDMTLSAEMTTYRQALRDFTSHANWPNLSDDDWPTKP